MTTVHEPTSTATGTGDRGAFYKNPKVAGYTDVPYEEKERLIGLVKADMRFPDYLYECGICVSAPGGWSIFRSRSWRANVG